MQAWQCTRSNFVSVANNNGTTGTSVAEKLSRVVGDRRLLTPAIGVVYATFPARNSANFRNYDVNSRATVPDILRCVSQTYQILKSV